MKRLMTEKASSEAFLPTASIRNTADSDPNNDPIHRRLLIQVAWSRLMLMASCSMMEGMAEEVKAMQIP